MPNSCLDLHSNPLALEHGSVGARFALQRRRRRDGAAALEDDGSNLARDGHGDPHRHINDDHDCRDGNVDW